MTSRPILLALLTLASATFVPMPAAEASPPPAASASDGFTAFFAPNAQVQVVAPTLDVMTVVYRPPPSYPDAVVARIGFDQSISARFVSGSGSPYPEWFTVSDTLAGRRADGTWIVVESLDTAGGAHPTGFQMTVAGKTFDDVMPARPSTSVGVAAVSLPPVVFQGFGSEPIESGGNGRFAADLSTHVKTWNWHLQATVRYDVGPVASQNDMNPEQDPRRWFFHRGVSSYAPEGYASASDGAWIHLAPFTDARIVAPDGKRMTVTYNPLGDGSACSLLQESYSCLEPVVVRVSFGGAVLSAREAYNPWKSVPLRRFAVQENLLNAPLDGTWTVENGKNKYGLPAGIRISVGGKVFDNVDEGGGDIQTTGAADVARGVAPHGRTWNWHVQASGSTHRAHLGSETHPVEHPGNLRLLGHSFLGVAPGPALGEIDAPTIPERVKAYAAPDGSTCAYFDADGDAQPGPTELHRCVPPVGAEVSRFLPAAGTLGAATVTATDSPGVYRFRVPFTGQVPPHQVALVTQGSYWTAADAVFYPRGYGGDGWHLMWSQDPVTFDGAWYEVTLQLKPGAHVFHVEAVDPAMRWIRGGDQTTPSVS